MPNLHKPNRSSAQSRSAGFTLMEVMIVVVIVSILMGIALPAYQDSVRKGRRADAKAGLSDAANRQEQLMLDRNRYTEDMTELGYAADPMISEEGHYSIAAEACDSNSVMTCYILTATPRSSSPQIDDTKCTSFILASSGVRSATGSAKDSCW